VRSYLARHLPKPVPAMIMLFRRMGVALRKRQFGQMFYEFMLIFLAVMAGFAAENWRENLEDKRRLKEYYSNMRNDLQADELRIQELIPFLNQRKQDYVFIFKQLYGSPSDSEVVEVYRKARFVARGRFFFDVQSQTYDQMKSTGDLRLVRNNRLLDGLGLYYTTKDAVYRDLPAELEHLHHCEAQLFSGKAYFELAIGGRKQQLMDYGGRLKRKFQDDPAKEMYVHALQQVYGSLDTQQKFVIDLIEKTRILEKGVAAELKKLE
jgi:hypothetical protein